MGVGGLQSTQEQWEGGGGGGHKGTKRAPNLYSKGTSTTTTTTEKERDRIMNNNTSVAL